MIRREAAIIIIW